MISNHNPKSNLPFVSKIIDKIVHQQLSDFLSSNYFDYFYMWILTSQQTALIEALNCIHLHPDSGQISVLLDLSAAFDTVSITILLDELENWAGLLGSYV